MPSPQHQRTRAALDPKIEASLPNSPPEVVVDPQGVIATSQATRNRMVGNRSRDTKPELALRSTLHRMGLRFRVQVRPIPALRRKADIVFSKQRIAVFVDGCFWHGCGAHKALPKTNVKFWTDKIDRNRLRDADTDRKLVEAGWQSIRVWEHEDVSQAALRVARAVRHVRNEMLSAQVERELGKGS